MRRLQSAIRVGLLLGSLLLLVFASACYWWRFDWCMAATVFPPWCWAGAGLMLTTLGWAIGRRAAPERHSQNNDLSTTKRETESGSKAHATTVAPERRSIGKRIAIGLAGAWLVFLTLFADSPLSLLRAWMPAPHTSESIRVVTFNCMSDLGAIKEVVPLAPDIILFQESRGPLELESLGMQMYGPGEHVCWGPDASIVARGKVKSVEVPAEIRGNLVHAAVELDGTTIDVLSLRLMPSVFRLDLWSPSCWKAFRRNREQRRRQLAQMVRYVETIPADRAVIFGGDFNAPPGDAVLRMLRPRFTDAFCVAGRGWGGTITSDWSAIRIDQIWISGPITPMWVWSRRSQFSDHRMAIGEFLVGEAR